MVLVPENTLERLQQRQQILTPPVTQTLRNLDRARMNVPENLVRNPQRQSAIREFKARVRDETPNSPSRWLPSPPVTSSPVKKQRRRNASPRPEAVRWLRL